MPDQSIIVVQQPVWPFAGRLLALTVKPDCVEFKGEDNDHAIPRDKITDVAYLAEQFRGMRVYEFEALCKGLHHIDKAVYPYWMMLPPSVPALDAVFAAQRHDMDQA